MNNVQELNEVRIRDFDPVGISILFTIFSTALKVVGLTIESGTAASENSEIRTRFRAVRIEILNLQNSLDDFILLLDRYIREREDTKIGEQPLTISDTLLVLKERNHVRYNSIQDAIEEINRRIYHQIKEVRLLGMDLISAESVQAPLDKEFIHGFDSTILHMGNITFSEFISRLRELLTGLNQKLMEYAQMRTRQG